MGKIKRKKNKNKNTEIAKTTIVNSRKNMRKERRQLKKLHRKEYFGKNINKTADTNDDVGKFVRFPRKDDFANEVDSTGKQSKKSNFNKHDAKDSDIILNESKGAQKREDKLKDQMKKQRNSQLLNANKEEDMIIRKLEKQLKLKKGKGSNMTKSFASDGLGYLLEVCDESTMAAAVAAEKHLANTGSGSESDFEEDLAIATGQSKLKHSLSTKKSKPNTSNGLNNSKDNFDVRTVDFDDDEGDEDDENDEDDEDDEDGDNCESDSSEDSLKNIVALSKKKKVSRIDTPKNKTIKNEVPKNKEFQKPIKMLESEEEDSDDSELRDSYGSDDFPSDDELKNMTLSDDENELEMIDDSGLSFPDGIFVPGNLTPVMEETEHDLDLDNRNVKTQQPTTQKTVHKFINSATHSSDEEMDSDDECGRYSDDSDSECASECSDPECEGSDCQNSEGENKQIIVNGKKINTYGRDVNIETEPDIVRCPILDQYLDDLQEWEKECDSNVTTRKDAAKKIVTRGNKESDKKPIKRKLVDKAAEKAVAKKLKVNEKNIPNSKIKSILKEINSDSDDGVSEDEEYMSDQDTEEEESAKSNAEDEIWEDIYGRKRDHDGNVITNQKEKYIPPHLRNASNLEESKEMIQLKRQIKGLLNKVSGSNMHWTSSQLEGIYGKNSRNTVNNAFCSLWLAAVVQSTTTADRLAAEHAMLVATLHANVGSEVGAHFLQTTVKKFNEMITSNSKPNDKELNNLVLGISHLYNFKLFQASLLYEILGKLIENLSEQNIDCVLVALRSVGAVLRKEDPAALKVFIHTTQEKASKVKGDTCDGTRIKFLLDVLLAIKNNNMNKIPNYDPSYSEELKKSIKGIIRKGNYIVTLNIQMDDLLKADERGRWWVVGSAWEGSKKEDKKPAGGSKGDEEDSQQGNLMELARHQRINTDLRRNIFCIIMSAEDYMDAFEKLQQLGLKNQQEREIVNVLISCTLQEKVYNPYYSLLAQKLCDFDRKFQMSIQYSVWDKLKEIEGFPAFQIANLAQFLTHLFIEKGLPISILKVIQFSDLTKPTLRLMRQILLAILMHKNSSTCLEVFERVAAPPKLRIFREGLRLFISHFLLKNSAKKENVLTDEQTILLKERAAAVETVLQTDSKLRF